MDESTRAARVRAPVVMSRDTSFYYSFLVLPARKRRAILAVWDFCRAVDDAVDEAGDDAADEAVGEAAPVRAAARLSMWRAELEACYAGGIGGDAGRGGPSTTQGKALQPYIREFNLPRVPFEELIDGVAMAVAHARYPTFGALAESGAWDPAPLEADLAARRVPFALTTIDIAPPLADGATVEDMLFAYFWRMAAVRDGLRAEYTELTNGPLHVWVPREGED